MENAPTSPVYYRVNKDSSYYSEYDYTLTYMDIERLQRYKAKGRWIGFMTRQEAVAYAEERGWIKVDTWKEAKELARPHIEAAKAAREERAKAADEALVHTLGEAQLKLTTLERGGAALKVWVGSDGRLRMREMVAH